MSVSPENVSLAASLASLPQSERDRVLAEIPDEELAALEYDWRFWARPNQLPPPGDWTFWLMLAGRGFGKTRSGAEFVRDMKDRMSPIALVAPTAGDARDVMVEGPAGLLAIAPPWDRPVYEPSKRRVTWKNGAMATLFSADEPERLRGPQHMLAWADELGAWRYPETWDMLMFGLRLGVAPKCAITTTPKPIKLIRDLLKDPACVVTRGSTFANRANLSKVFFDTVVAKYAGTRLGRQEIEAEVLEDVPGALWTIEAIQHVPEPDTEEEREELIRRMKRIIVSVDPSGCRGPDDIRSDEIGIVVAGVDDQDVGYVLSDMSGRYSPEAWGRVAVQAFGKWKADRIVGEVNYGGGMVESTIRAIDYGVPFSEVHVSRGKWVRAEPVAALYEQGRVFHVGSFPALEDQMLYFTAGGYMGDKSPDRADAMVWALTELMLGDNSYDTTLRWVA